MAIEWCSTFSVGNATLDDQHKKLLDMCDRLQASDAIAVRDAQALWHEVLNEMTEYAKRHFLTEERLLRQAGFPSLSEHLDEHFAFEEWVTALNFKAIEGQVLLDEARDFLREWWLTHILSSDMQYKECLLKHAETFAN